MMQLTSRTHSPARLAGLALLASVLLGAFLATPVRAQRIRDLSRVEGDRAVQLSGMGLVIGLPGTGDSQQNTLMKQYLRQLIVNMGLSDDITIDDLRPKNVAMVMVSVTLSSSHKVGSEFQAVVSSTGDAESLRGGYVLGIPLAETKAVRRVNGKAAPEYYAVADGPLLVDDVAQKVTSGKVRATLQRPLDTRNLLQNLEDITILLNEPDYGIASRITAKINEHDLFRDPTAPLISQTIARAIDEGTVKVRIPSDYLRRDGVIDFISQVMEIEVPDLDREARLAVNRTTGTVVINGAVRVAHSALIKYKGALIRIPRVGARAEAGEEDGVENTFDQNPLLMDVIKELEADLLGFTGQDLVNILKLLEKSGAIIGKFVED